jgi:hypothetical protein
MDKSIPCISDICCDELLIISRAISYWKELTTSKNFKPKQVNFLIDIRHFGSKSTLLPIRRNWMILKYLSNLIDNQGVFKRYDKSHYCDLLKRLDKTILQDLCKQRGLQERSSKIKMITQLTQHLDDHEIREIIDSNLKEVRYFFQLSPDLIEVVTDEQKYKEFKKQSRVLFRRMPQADKRDDPVNIPPNIELEEQVGIIYDPSAAEHDVIRQLLENNHLDQAISRKFKKYGFNAQILWAETNWIARAIGPDEFALLNKISLTPDQKTMNNYICIIHYLDPYKFPLEYQITDNELSTIIQNLDQTRRKLIAAYLLYEYKEYETDYQAKTCINCNRQFSADQCVYWCTEFEDTSLFKSIFSDYRSIHDIQICSMCLYGLSHPNSRPVSEGVDPKEEFLDNLRILHKLLGQIPPRDFVSSSFISKISRSREEALAIISHIRMMKRNVYMYDLPNWLSILCEAGILEEPVLKAGMGYQCIAKDGHICLSLTEKIIDDYFSDNQILHEKEPLYPKDPLLNPSGLMRADWKIEENVYIEYFGLAGNGEYDIRIAEKKELANKYGISLICLYPRDEYSLGEILRLYNVGLSSETM